MSEFQNKSDFVAQLIAKIWQKCEFSLPSILDCKCLRDRTQITNKCYIDYFQNIFVLHTIAILYTAIYINIQCYWS